MSKPARSKHAKSKTAKNSSMRFLEKDEEIIRSSIMKFAEEMYEFDEQGVVIKRNYDSRGMEINKQEDEDAEIDPESLKEKEEKKIKLLKQKKKKIDSNKGISFGDLLKEPD